jgi:hypothetical protein
MNTFGLKLSFPIAWNPNLITPNLKSPTKVHWNVLNQPKGYGNSVVEIWDNKYKSVKHLDYYKSAGKRVQNQVEYRGIDLSSAPCKDFSTWGWKIERRERGKNGRKLTVCSGDSPLITKWNPLLLGACPTWPYFNYTVIGGVWTCVEAEGGVWM